ncbi:unnamed protein product [Schistosoma mattheei]|uniref:Uncharacterized protein n=1 Tax=Schistosoma mattheei TaxID=31246 RepID=A0A183PSQ1_9TREM|nr:unnamed protein product [Schistosoma mattheei]
MRSKVESHDGCLSKNDDLMEELKTAIVKGSEQLKVSERLICALTKFRNARILSDEPTNQRITQNSTLSENNDVEIITNPDDSAAGPTDAANLSQVIQCSDLPMKSANLPLMSVVTSDNQCISNDNTDPIFSSLTLKAHKQILSFNVTSLKSTVKIKKFMTRKKNVCTEPSGPIPNNKNITIALLNKKSILHDTIIYHTHLWGGYQDTLHSNVSHDGHFNYGLSRPNIRQTTVKRRAPRLHESNLPSTKNN